MSNEIKDVTLDMSKLHPWSIGIVIHDIKIGEDIIDIYPIEKIPDEDVNLWVKNNFKETIINTNPKDNETIDSDEVIVLKKSVSVKAMWLGNNQYNRITPPTIRKEEYVQIYRYSNADIFFWDTIRNDVRLRKEEVVTHAYSNKPDIDMDETLDNMVYKKIDTKNKIVHFHTPNTNGGLITYDFTLDYGKGQFELLDGKKNQILLDSDKDKFSTHIEGTKNQYDLTVDGDNGFIEIKDDKGNTIKLDSVNDKYILDINKAIETTTINETKNVTKNLQINLDKVAIKNGTTELITLLMAWLDANVADIGVGNLGLPVSRSSSTQSAYKAIKAKMATLKI